MSAGVSANFAVFPLGSTRQPLRNRNSGEPAVLKRQAISHEALI